MELLYESTITHIQAEMSKQNYFCTTADIWSCKNRSFLGVTVHWIDDNLERRSAALSCSRFKGVHSFNRIAEALDEINIKFYLNYKNIVSTITDNGSNFVKAFKEFSYVTPELDDMDDGAEDDEVLQFEYISEGDRNDQDNINIILPRHLRCASHTLNLIATTDMKNILQKNTILRSRNIHAINKCSLLWNKANRPKSAEVIKGVLGHALSTPGATRWNSLYDSITQILKEKEKLPVLFKELDLNSSFKDAELAYLEQYVNIMKPLAQTIDLLQGEECCFYGFLLPSILSLHRKWTKMIDSSLDQVGLILRGCIDALNNRYGLLLNLECDTATIAAVSHPRFKLRWLCGIEDKKVEEESNKIKTKILNLINEENFEIMDSSPTGSEEDDFFVFEKRGTNKDVGHNEIQLLNYLQDKRCDIKMLNDYPAMKKIFLKYNTPLPSSAAVERLFSFATMINTPRRHGLSDNNFEMLTLLKANKVYH
ncbi:uncharacterized protein [Onthophagus taurus]|uniref:uncharacterized protein n=1 Tax=Onthophagus taurus TaxID=166361 RepID=UPI0039BEBAF7